MAQPRTLILEWAEQGRIAPGELRRALELAAALPSGAQWRRFLDRLMLFMGGTMLAASVVFFIAYNWQDLGRFAKFALAEVPIVVALALVWRSGLERASGEAALFVAALLVGALLALVGQVYQTGADTFELFAAWALCVLPWVLIGRSAALWLVWLVLVNLACAFYFQVMPGILGFAFSAERQLWWLFAIDTLALAAWEGARAYGFPWLQGRWAPRLLATASGALVTALAVIAVVDRQGSLWSLVAWVAWLGAAGFIYRRQVKDLYVLAGGVLSVIVVTVTFFERQFSLSRAADLLTIGLIVISISAGAAYWLRRLAAEEP